MGKQVASPARQEEQARLDKLETEARRKYDEAQKNAAPGPDEDVGTEAAAPEGARQLGSAVIPEHARQRPDAGPHLYVLRTSGAILDGAKREIGYRISLTPALAKAYQNAGIGLTRVEE